MVSMPRSPARATRAMPKRSRIVRTWELTAVESAVLPANTSTATGQPATAHSRPQTIWRLPLLAVAVGAEGGQGAAVPFEVRGGDVVEDEGAVLEVAAGEAALDPGRRWRSQSSMASSSLPETGPRPNREPREE